MTESQDDPLSDLMRRAIAGDQKAYADFLRQVTVSLGKFIKRRVPPSDVDDIVQEILLSIHKARNTYDGLRPVKPWVAAIARYRLMDYMRRHYADKKDVTSDIADIQDFLAAPVTEDADWREMVREALSYLAEREQNILKLMHIEGFTAKEIGEKLGMNESAVKVAAFRAYRTIRQKIGG